MTTQRATRKNSLEETLWDTANGSMSNNIKGEIDIRKKLVNMMITINNASNPVPIIA